ncbi:MAG: 3-deoxy-manno-octulosonate cytidylyltransferase [Alphaproteobacteria bacterium]
MDKDSIVLIPSRLSASRLPNKPLLKIHGQEMILHCYERAVAADVGRVVVCAGDEEIVDCVKKKGGEAILTPADLPSGTDRIYYGLKKLANHQQYKRIINLQGDIPNMSPFMLKKIADGLLCRDYGIITPVCLQKNQAKKNNPDVVKAICQMNDNEKPLPIFYFTRSPAPYGDDMFFHHIGVYGYQRDILEKFVTLKPSLLEKTEKLEQLRALENGIKIFAVVVKDKPLSVDTAEDLAIAQKIMQKK